MIQKIAPSPMLRRAAGALAIALSVATVHGQTIQVGHNIRVATGLENRPLVEPHLAAHPSKPNHLLAATIVGDAARTWGDTQICASFLSIDGGQQWARHDFAIAECGDPWVAITPAGDAVFIALGKHVALPDQSRGGLVVFHSADGGFTWDDKPVGLGTGHDHPTIAIDTSSSARANWVYVVSGRGVRVDNHQRWSVFIARSMDGGRTFGEPVTVVPSNLNLNAEVPVVLSDGTLIASFGDFQRNVDNGARGRGMLDRRREWMLRSTDGGKTFSSPLFASEACGMGWSSFAADTSSGSFRDRLYFACKEKSGQAIVVNASADRSEIWTDPLRTDADSTVTTIARRDEPALAVNSAGVVAMAWIETHEQAHAFCQQVRVTASLDGGRTFLPSRRVSDAESCPDSAANGAAYGRWSRGGDYFGLAATADGVFHVLWSDARDKVFQLWTATVDVPTR
jgi:hypothetical protein